MYTIITTFLLILFFLLSKRFFICRKVLLIINTIVCLVYISWRLTVIPVNSGFLPSLLGTILFLAEFMGLISFFIFQYIFSQEYNLDLRTLDDFEKDNIPTVDVLICTYNESLSLLEKTIAACTNLDYPKNKIKIYICDDGRRENLKILCDKYNIGYITREDNSHAKAGNINNALKYITGDLFAILDADMIPKKEFLTKTIGYFVKENVAFVQTPQVYYNQDMYQYNLSRYIPNEQDFFMRDIQEARASLNSVLHVGTNAIFRRKYIDEINGYPTFSITEDMAVGLMLQEKGYDSIFVNEELVLGLSATTFTELVKQRDRWCRGNLQVFKHINLLKLKGLNLKQKIAYIDGIIYWFSNLQKMIYILCPLIFLFTRTLIINSSLENLSKVYIPFLLGQFIIFKALSPGTRNLLWAHYYDITMAPHLSISILKEIFSLKINFNVTSKDIRYDKKKFNFNIVLPHIILIIATILSWIISIPSVINGTLDLGAFMLNLIWSIFNFIGAATSIKVAYQKPIFRLSERITIKDKIPVKLVIDSSTSIMGKLLDISEQGVGIVLDECLSLYTNTNVDLVVNNINFKCTIRRITDNIIGLQFKELSSSQMKLIMNLFTQNMQPYFHVNKVK